MRDRQLLRSAIAEALAAVRHGDEGEALLMFERLAGSSWRTLRDTVLELAEANFEMLLTMTGSDRDDDIVISLADEDGVGGDGAFFLLLDEPEVYGLPPDPVVTTRDLPSMWKHAGAAALTLLAGLAVTFLGRRR